MESSGLFSNLQSKDELITQVSKYSNIVCLAMRFMLVVYLKVNVSEIKATHSRSNQTKLLCEEPTKQPHFSKSFF